MPGVHANLWSGTSSLTKFVQREDRANMIIQPWLRSIPGIRLAPWRSTALAERPVQDHSNRIPCHPKSYKTATNRWQSSSPGFCLLTVLDCLVFVPNASNHGLLFNVRGRLFKERAEDSTLFCPKVIEAVVREVCTGEGDEACLLTLFPEIHIQMLLVCDTALQTFG